LIPFFATAGFEVFGSCAGEAEFVWETDDRFEIIDCDD